MACVLLDVDGTLLEGPSSERLFLRHLAAHHRLGWQQWASALQFCMRWWPVYGRHVLKKNKAYLAGLEVREIEDCAKRFVQETLAGYLRPSMLQRIEMHRRAGEPMALLTGAPRWIARPLAQQLGIQAFSATECSVRQGRFSREPPAIHPFGANKLEQAHRLCERQGWSLADCTAYADSIHDIELMRHVARPVAVHPDRRLRAIARRERWEIVPR